ncbi:flavin reductase family protein [Streptomyces sp. NPDC056690]|uniref:flavin reductase family protein n=1 Tax=unclassified Streptomyces TaxID=2593676 RepID=UPI00363F4975
MTFADPQDPAAFRRILGHYPTGVVVITAMAQDGPVGMAVGTFTSISLEPPLVGFFPDRNSSTWARISAVGAFCANILGEDHEDICRTFATRGIDRFATVDWMPGPTGSPVLTDAIAWADCRVSEDHPIGDHQLVVGQVTTLALHAGEATHRPLVFHRSRYGTTTTADVTSSLPLEGAWL